MSSPSPSNKRKRSSYVDYTKNNGSGRHHGQRRRRQLGSGGGGCSELLRGGAPGILLTCETGRERKCRREGKDILQHYWDKHCFEKQKQQQQQQQKDHSAIASTAARDDGGGDDDDHRNQQIEGDDEKLPPSPEKSGKDNLSFEQELASLKKDGTHKQKTCSPSLPFDVYETGCKGSVMFICTLPEYHNHHQRHWSNSGDHDNGGDKNDDGEAEKGEEVKVDKKEGKDPTAVDEESAPPDNDNITGNSSTCWDPVQTVHSIIKDIQQQQQQQQDRAAGRNRGDADEAEVQEISNKGACESATAMMMAPGSRFITRMIPIQATCFADPVQIANTVDMLLKRYIMSQKQNQQSNSTETSTSTSTTKTTTTTTTFSIRSKRRNCSHLNRQGIIDIVAKQVGLTTTTECASTTATPSEKGGEEEEGKTTWKVDLSSPQVQIWIEVCRTMCGVSVIPSQYVVRNFNITEIRLNNN